MPPEMGNFPLEVQQAFLIHSLLSDRWEGMSGYYMGKDWSPLQTLLDIWGIEDKRTVVYFLKHIETYNSNEINKKQSERQKAQERQAKAKSR